MMTTQGRWSVKVVTLNFHMQLGSWKRQRQRLRRQPGKWRQVPHIGVTVNTNRIERGTLNASHAVLNNCLEQMFAYYRYNPSFSHSNALFFGIIHYRNTINTKRLSSLLHNEQFELKHTKLKIISIYVKYRVCINYRRILQNHMFTNTEHKHMMLLPFEREMFAVS